MALTQRIPTLHPDYNDPTPYVLHELRETKRQLIAQIEVLSQRIDVMERWCQEASRGRG